jgi:hypothetical protein
MNRVQIIHKKAVMALRGIEPIPTYCGLDN